jgi:hypothetical protein
LAIIDIREMCKFVFKITNEDIDSEKFSKIIEIDIHKTAEIWKWIKYKEKTNVPHCALALMDNLIGMKFDNWPSLESFIKYPLLKDIFKINQEESIGLH